MSNSVSNPAVFQPVQQAAPGVQVHSVRQEELRQQNEMLQNQNSMLHQQAQLQAENRVLQQQISTSSSIRQPVGADMGAGGGSGVPVVQGTPAACPMTTASAPPLGQ